MMMGRTYCKLVFLLLVRFSTFYSYTDVGMLLILTTSSLQPSSRQQEEIMPSSLTVSAVSSSASSSSGSSEMYYGFQYEGFQDYYAEDFRFVPLFVRRYVLFSWSFHDLCLLTCFLFSWSFDVYVCWMLIQILGGTPPLPLDLVEESQTVATLGYDA